MKRPVNEGKRRKPRKGIAEAKGVPCDGIVHGHVL